MKLHLASFLTGLAAGGAAMLLLCLAVLFGLAWKMHLRGRQDGAPAAFCPTVGDTNVTQILRPLRDQFHLPAMAAAVVTSEGIQWVGAVGVRKRGTHVAVGLNDLWHLGSDGKIMTSTLVARLVERGKLRWDTPLAEVFPELASGLDPQFRTVTMRELLSHHAGLPANLDLRAYGGDHASQLRMLAVKDELAGKPLSPPGTTYLYSNLGYIIAAAAVEKITGETWERLEQEEVFQTLKMASAGFGGTGTPGVIDQPWPHPEDGQPADDNGPGMDNPPVMGPAGRIHCSIQDWAKFVQDQLRGARGLPALLRPESYQTLQTPPYGGDYALGWNVVSRGWAGGKALCHAGDNTLNCANAWVAPNKNFAILVCVNQSGDQAFEATDQAVGALVRLLEKTP